MTDPAKDPILTRGAANYAKHRETILTKKHAYDAAHREENAMKAAAYRAADPEKAKTISRTHHAKHRDKRNAASRADHLKNRDKRNAKHAAWMKEHADEQRTWRREHREAFYAYRAQWRAEHRQKERETQAAWNAEHPGSAQERQLRYRLNNPGRKAFIEAKRRARKMALPDTWTRDERLFMLHYWGHACAICGAQEGFWWTLANDHWIPLASPQCPGTMATNMLPLCDGKTGCNTSKNAADPTQWLTEKYGPRKAAKILKTIATYFATVQTLFPSVT
jgi:hypothetical protein